QPLESEIWPHGRSLEAVAAAACQRGWAADRPGAGIVAYTPQMERSDEATADGAAPHSRLRQPSGAVPAGAELSNRVVHPLPRPEGAHKAMPSRSTWAGS